MIGRFSKSGSGSADVATKPAGQKERPSRAPGRAANEIQNAARIEGMESLRDTAVRKLAEGITTFEEVARITADGE